MAENRETQAERQTPGQRRRGIADQIRRRIGLDVLLVLIVVAAASIFMARGVLMETKRE